MRRLFIWMFFVLAALIVLSACKRQLHFPNDAPVANAGRDTILVPPVNSTFLDGSASKDPDNNISGYLWTKISGPSSFNILNANAVKTGINNLINGVYEFELKITDAGGLFSKDTIQITVNGDDNTCSYGNRPKINAQLILVGSLSKARMRMATASAANKIVFAGGICLDTPEEGHGSSRVDIFDIPSQTWSTAELSSPRFGIAAIALGTKIFFAGGEYGDGALDTYSSVVDVYDAATNTWSVLTGLSVPRSNIAAAIVDNKIFFAGGEKGTSYQVFNIVDIYDAAANKWSTASLSDARSFISAVTVNHKIYFAGGSKEDRFYNQPSDKIDIYDNATGSWSVSSLYEPKQFMAAIAVADKIYIAGGNKDGGDLSNASCSVEIKDLTSGTSSIDHLYKPGGWVFYNNSNAVLKNNKIAFCRIESSLNNGFDIYDIATRTWSIGILDQSLYLAWPSIISVNNIIYVAGGDLDPISGPLSKKVWRLEF